MEPYLLTDGTVFYVSLVCSESLPCKHWVYTSKRPNGEIMNGRNIGKLLAKRGVASVPPHFERYATLRGGPGVSTSVQTLSPCNLRPGVPDCTGKFCGGGVGIAGADDVAPWVQAPSGVRGAPRNRVVSG